MGFEREQETFKARLPELSAAHEGEFAFIHGEDVLGIFPTYKEAVEAGTGRMGPGKSFLVGWIKSPEREGVLLPSFVTVTVPDKARKEREAKELEAMRARIREEYGSVEAFLLEAMGLGPASSHPT